MRIERLAGAISSFEAEDFERVLLDGPLSYGARDSSESESIEEAVDSIEVPRGRVCGFVGGRSVVASPG